MKVADTFDHPVTFNKQLTYNTPARHIVRETPIEMETTEKPSFEIAPTTLETFSSPNTTLLVDFHFLPTDIAVNF